MQGLVDYGSDSDDDAPAPAPPPPKPASSLNLPPPKASSGLSLPPPKGSTSATQPPAKAAQVPPPTKKSKDKGPVRILLDLPPPSAAGAAGADDDDEPARKKPKLALGGGGGLTGLAAMLPKPKNEVKAVAAPAPTRALGGGAGNGGLLGGAETQERGVAKPAGMFLPPAVAAKGKGKAGPPKPAPEPEAPAVDFFGLGSVTSAPPPSSSSSSNSKSTFSAAPSAPSISAAPSVSSAPPPKPPPSSLPSAAQAYKQPTAADPYPGFTQLPSGEWVAKDQQTYEMWMAWQAQQAANPPLPEGEDIPKGFDEKDIAGSGGYVDVDEAQRARDAWATRPSTVPGREEEYKKGSDVKGIPKQLSGGAKRKHQLSSLLAAAHDNRAELEDRIAQARANRKSAGNKYGF